MGFHFELHHDLRLVYKKVWGPYGDDASALSHEEWELINKEGEVGDYDELQDLTAVSEYSVSLANIRRLATRYDQKWNDGNHAAKKLAYVVPSALAFGTGRVYGTLIGLNTGINFKVFESMADAAAWLDLSDADLSRVIAKKPELPAAGHKESGAATPGT